MILLHSLKSEYTKTKHSSYLWIHLLIPFFGAILFVLYFSLYESTPLYNRCKMILELTATVFPILIGIITAVVTNMEEKASYFYRLLSFEHRRGIYLSKLLLLFLSGTFSVLLLFGLFAGGVTIITPIESFPYFILLKSFLALIISGLFFYTVHLFISFKFSIGISIFISIVEALLTILFSNVSLPGIWKFIPFSWSVKLSEFVLQGKQSEFYSGLVTLIIITVITIFITTTWFQQWEGKKSYE